MRAGICEHDCGLVLTSPPYPGVYDYLPMQQLRAAWLDLDLNPGSAGRLAPSKLPREGPKGCTEAVA